MRINSRRRDDLRRGHPAHLLCWGQGSPALRGAPVACARMTEQHGDACFIQRWSGPPAIAQSSTSRRRRHGSLVFLKNFPKINQRDGPRRRRWSPTAGLRLVGQREGSPGLTGPSSPPTARRLLEPPPHQHRSGNLPRPRAGRRRPCAAWRDGEMRTGRPAPSSLPLTGQPMPDTRVGLRRAPSRPAWRPPNRARVVYTSPWARSATFEGIRLPVWTPLPSAFLHGAAGRDRLGQEVRGPWPSARRLLQHARAGTHAEGHPPRGGLDRSPADRRQPGVRRRLPGSDLPPAASPLRAAARVAAGGEHAVRDACPRRGAAESAGPSSGPRSWPPRSVTPRPG